MEPTAEPTAAEPTTPPEEAKLFPPEMPSAVRGQAVFDANCATCHGAAGDGSGLAGAADFTDVEFMRGEKPAEFFEAIRDGVEGTAMPAWGETLSEMDIWDVLYYEWAFATSPEEIAGGQALFGENCVACHGAAGDGSGLPGAANFTDQEFMANEDPAEFFEKIAEGVEGSAMPAWGETFSEDEIWALVNYVWTFAYEYPAESSAEPSHVERPPAGAATPQSRRRANCHRRSRAAGEPDPAVGAQLWAQKPCIGCHGAAGRGRHRPQAGRDHPRIRRGAAPGADRQGAHASL